MSERDALVESAARVLRASQTLEAYAKTKDFDLEREIRDLLVDLLHLGRSRGITLDLPRIAAESATRFYRESLAGGLSTRRAEPKRKDPRPRKVEPEG